MSWKYKDDLKIEFRAIPYGTAHVLEYRISPYQDLNFKVEKSFLGFKYTKKDKFKTNWHRPLRFRNYSISYRYEENDCYYPISIYNIDDLRYYQNKFSTIGEFFDYINEYEESEKAKWRIERDKYLQKNKIWT